MDFEILTGRKNKQLVEYNNHLIHPQALKAFKELCQLAKDEIGAQIEIVSSFRNFERQLNGWNLKASGKRPLYDDNDNALNYERLTPQEILLAIVKWSMVPGASRHHWGTDIDIFDANKMNKDQVELLQSECLPEGPFGELHLWLDEKINQDQSFGFFRPYNTNRDGVGIEKWHLSFSPVSLKYDELYTKDVFIKNIELADIKLKDELLDKIDLIFNQYVKNTDSCPF